MSASTAPSASDGLRPLRRMRLRAPQNGVTVRDVTDATGFELIIHENVERPPPPEPEELAILREPAAT